MDKGKKDVVAAVGTERGRSPSGVETAAGAGAPQRWSPRRKQDAVMRLFRGEYAEALSRELGVEVHRLEQWREKALAGMASGLRERNGDPLLAELDQAKKRIGELSMDNELLRLRCEKKLPSPRRRWK